MEEYRKVLAAIILFVNPTQELLMQAPKSGNVHKAWDISKIFVLLPDITVITHPVSYLLNVRKWLQW